MKNYLAAALGIIMLLTGCVNTQEELYRKTANKADAGYANSKIKHEDTKGTMESNTAGKGGENGPGGGPEVIEDGLELTIIKERIHPSLPEYSFHVYGRRKEGGYCADRISIYAAGKEDKLIQEITFDETETPDKEALGVIIEDMNFDGYKDIRIQQFIPASPNVPYYYWLWNEEANQYAENTDLERITSPEFDHENKLIKSLVRVNAVTHAERIYKYIDGVPALVRETESIVDADKKVEHITVRELKDSEFQVVRKYDRPLETDAGQSTGMLGSD